MKKLLLITFAASLLFSHSTTLSIPTLSMPIFTDNLNFLGIPKALVLGLALWFTAQSKYVKDDNVKNIFRHAAILIPSSDVLLACLDSKDLGKFTGDIPLIGEWVKKHFFDCAGKQKETTARLLGLITSVVTVPLLKA